MRRALILATATTLAALMIPSPASAAEAEVPSGTPGESPCLEPVPTFAYDESVLAYGIEVDLAGCDWWDGTEIELSVDIERFTGLEDEGTNVAVLCGGMVITYPEDGGPVETPVADSCGVIAEMEHPSVEVARYRGQVTYPWEGGTVTAGFDAVCVGTPLSGHCQQIPGAEGRDREPAGGEESSGDHDRSEGEPDSSSLRPRRIPATGQTPTLMGS